MLNEKPSEVRSEPHVRGLPLVRNRDRLFAASRVPANKVRGLIESELALFRRIACVATTPSERLSLLLFVLRHACARITRYHLAGGDTTIRLRGRKYVVGLISGEVEIFPEIYAERIYDRRIDFIPQPGWVVFDVGANVGLFSLLQATRGACVHAFEPNPACFRRLRKNVMEGGCSNRIATHNLAIGSAPGTARLSVPWSATHSGSLVAPGIGTRLSEVSVDITTLDQMLVDTGVSRIDLLKIDVEGWEAEVLLGASRTLSITDRVIAEYHSQLLYARIRDALREKGFVSVEDVLCYPPDVGILYMTRPGASL